MSTRRASTPTTSQVIRATPILTALVLLASCNQYVANPNMVKIAPGEIQGPIQAPVHQLTPAVQAFCSALQWETCQYPEYTDDQRFRGALATEYGPHSKIAPSPQLALYAKDADFVAAKAKLVAFVNVDTTGPLSEHYTALRLNAGFTCVYLRYDTQFAAYMTPESGGTCADSIDPDPSIALPVKAAPLPLGFAGDTSMPPVARFHEGIKGATTGVPLLGVRCGIKWCMILPVGADTLPLPMQGERPNSRTWTVHGWHDVQTLSDMTGTTLVRGDRVAAVIPVDTLVHMNKGNFKAGVFEHVATVRFWNEPSPQYKERWHFKKGDNPVYLKKNASGVWEGEVRYKVWKWGIMPVTMHYAMPVTRFVHSHEIPATARFMWSKFDEDLWVSCELGCCKVAGS